MNRKALTVSIALMCAAGCTTQSTSTASSGFKNDSSQLESPGRSVRYECYTYVGSRHVLTLPVAPLNSDIAMVTVTFHGDPMEATYLRTGLTQRWVFGESVYVELDPDFTAAYYDFTGAEEGEMRKPESVFECKKRSR